MKTKTISICPKCGEELYKITGLCTDRDGIREDSYCGDCNTRYGNRSHGMSILSEGVNYAMVTKENNMLKTTIQTMMKLKVDSDEFTDEIKRKILIHELGK
tara:strand:- start:252 stop:554 length:303 start_codon:yes stop_codon:yes gene_type:complete